MCVKVIKCTVHNVQLYLQVPETDPLCTYIIHSPPHSSIMKVIHFNFNRQIGGLRNKVSPIKLTNSSREQIYLLSICNGCCVHSKVFSPPLVIIIWVHQLGILICSLQFKLGFLLISPPIKRIDRIFCHFEGLIHFLKLHKYFSCFFSSTFFSQTFTLQLDTCCPPSNQNSVRVSYLRFCSAVVVPLPTL